MSESPAEQTPSPIAMVEGAGPTGSLFDRAYPQALRQKEAAILEARRRQAGVDPDGMDCLAVGLSGGGIRSATFCLGLFQALARKPGTLRRIDFLSTVSGGGYFGTFFGRLLTRKFIKDPDEVEKTLRGEENTGVLKYLRENGRYLSPNGSGDLLLGGSVVLRNWLSIHLVLAISVLAVFLGIQVPLVLAGNKSWMITTADPFMTHLPWRDRIWWSYYSVLPCFAFLLAALPLGWAYWLVKPKSQAITEGAQEESAAAVKTSWRPWQESVLFSWLSAIAVLLLGLIFSAVPKDDPSSLMSRFEPLWLLLAVVAGATIVWRLIAGFTPVRDPGGSKAVKGISWQLFVNSTIRHRLSLWVTRALSLTAILLALALVDTLGQCLYVLLRGESSVGAWLAGTFSFVGVLAGFAQRILSLFSNNGKKDRPPVPLKILATVVALLLVFLYLVTIDAAAHAITWALQTPAIAPETLRVDKGKEELSLQVHGTRAALPLHVQVDTGKPAPPPKPPEALADGRDPYAAPAGFLITLLLALLFGRTFSFVNNSSHNQLYSERLTRAYLGSSNPERWDRGRSVTQVLPGDDCDVARYWPPPENNASPIHLINVTINETVDGRSQIQQQDRKGIGMAVGPFGLSAGVEHHAVISFGVPQNSDPHGKPVKVYPEIHDGENPPYRMFEYRGEDGKETFQGEALPIGSWVGISAAAFSTGTGYRTSLGLSLLAGIANVRIGRWWNSGVQRRRYSHDLMGVRYERNLSKLFPVQVFLLDEFFARFHGSARRFWYLSDGGHFENMGGYELIRRRLPWIVIVDAEQDADYNFEGLANLVLKARLDFAAEIKFLDDDQLNTVTNTGIQQIRPHLGSLDRLRRGRREKGKVVEVDHKGFSLAHAALAKVTYRFPDQESWLLYIKPSLIGNEPADVLTYHKAHPDFPHESTGDQFFDEAQWESYRKLGEHIGGLLFPA
jgi:hypothetical protein